MVGTVPAATTWSSCTVVTTTVSASTNPAAAAIANSRSLNPPPLPSRAPRSSTATQPGHHEVDRRERVDVDPLRAPARTLDAARGARVVGEAIRVEEEEGIALGEARNGHVHDLAVDERRCRTGHCGESGFAFSVAARAHSSVSARRRAAASAPTKFGMRLAGFGKRATPGTSSAAHTRSRSAAFAARTSGSPPASASCAPTPTY